MKENLLYKLIPVPHYLAMFAGGLDISDRSVKGVALREHKGKIIVDKFGEVEIPKGVIEFGEIRNKEKLTDVLRNLKKVINITNVIVSLPEEKSYIFFLSLPINSNAPVRDSIELQLEEHIPVAASEVVFDYERLNIHNNKFKHSDLNVSALPRNVVSSYCDVLKNAGFTTLAFEIEGQSIARSVINKDDNRTYIIVDIGRTRTSISIAERNVVWFTTSIHVGGDMLTNAIMRDKGVSEVEAEKIKIGSGLIGVGSVIDTSLVPIMSVLRDEISKNLSYWNTHIKEDKEHKKKPVNLMILSGGDAITPGLSEYLGIDLGISTTLANPWSNILDIETEIPPINAKASLKFAPAIGLAMRGIEI